MYVLLAVASDTGRRNVGESASPWHDWWFWTLLAVGALVLLGAVLYVTARGGGDDRPRAKRTEATPSDGRPVPRAVEHVEPEAGWELAVFGFQHLTGAERAYADVRGDGTAPWLHEVAFVAMHHHGRARLRGTFAGHYLDVEDAATLPASDVLLASIRDGVVEGESGLVTFAPADTVEHLAGAFEGRTTAVHRHRVSADEAASLAAVVAGTPAASV